MAVAFWVLEATVLVGLMPEARRLREQMSLVTLAEHLQSQLLQHFMLEVIPAVLAVRH